MSARRHHDLFGIVLHMSPYGDAHRVVDVLTAESGRITLLARGARASKRRFAGVLDLFATLRLQAQSGPGMWTLTAADAMTLRLGIRARLELLQRASYLCECVRRLTPEHHEAADMFRLLTVGLDALEGGDLAGAAEAYPRLLAASGILPSLETCGRCGAERQTVAVDSTAGSPLCPTCATARGDALGGATLQALKGGACVDAAVAAAVEACALRWIEQLLGKPLRSRALA